MTADPAYPLLESIDSPEALRTLPRSRLPELARELRAFLIETVSSTGGHLASNLGVVELTIALHYIYDTPEDRLVWDVGHQSYPHKILTGRRREMTRLRQRGGISGFTKISESPYDTFGAGHSSTSISAALGMAVAARARGESRRVVAIIGDGAIGAGMAFEALNHASDVDADLLVVLNDNEMSISPNVGGLSNHLARLLSGRLYSTVREGSKSVLNHMPSSLRELARRAEEHMKGMVIPGTLFEELGFNYIGPVDGHNLDTLVTTLSNMRSLRGPQLLHIVTRKGKGFEPAEANPCAFHGVSRFDPVTGAPTRPVAATPTPPPTWTSVFGQWVCRAADPLAEYRGPGGWRSRGGGHRAGRGAGDRVEPAHAVEGTGVGLRRFEPLPLAGDDVQKLWPPQGTHVAEGGDEGVQIVAVHRADVVETQLLEQGAGNHHPLHVLLGPPGQLPQAGGHVVEDALAPFAYGGVEPAREKAGQVVGEPSDVGRDGHLVVVEYHQQIGVHVGRMVEGFEGHAGTDRPVADNRHHPAGLPARAGGHRHAECGADGGAGVAGAEGVVGALGDLGETGDAAPLAQAGHLPAPAGEDLVGIALVAHVPHQPVLWGVVDVVEGDGQLHHPQVGGEMAAGAGDGLDQEGTQLPGQLGEPASGEGAQRFRRVDRLQQRIGGISGHRGRRGVSVNRKLSSAHGHSATAARLAGWQ